MQLLTCLFSSAAAFTLLTMSYDPERHLREVGVDANGCWSIEPETQLEAELDTYGFLRANDIAVLISDGIPTMEYKGTSKIKQWKIEDARLSASHGSQFYVCADGRVSTTAQWAGAAPIELYPV